MNDVSMVGHESAARQRRGYLGQRWSIPAGRRGQPTLKIDQSPVAARLNSAPVSALQPTRQHRILAYTVAGNTGAHGDIHAPAVQVFSAPNGQAQVERASEIARGKARRAAWDAGQHYDFTSIFGQPGGGHRHWYRLPWVIRIWAHAGALDLVVNQTHGS